MKFSKKDVVRAGKNLIDDDLLNDQEKFNSTMANSINVNGCSVCQPGRENYTSFTAKIGRKTVKRWQYDYRTESGELFSCAGVSLDSCRAKRDLWLSQKQ